LENTAFSEISLFFRSDCTGDSIGRAFLTLLREGGERNEAQKCPRELKLIRAHSLALRICPPSHQWGSPVV